MTTLSNQISINSDIETVFQFVSEFKNMPLWNYYILEVNQTDDPDVYQVIRKHDQQQFRLLEMVPGKQIVMELKSTKLIKITREMNFYEDRQVLITDYIKINSVLPGFLERKALKNVGEAVAENLGKLKELLETGKTILQDGREAQL